MAIWVKFLRMKNLVEKNVVTLSTFCDGFEKCYENKTHPNQKVFFLNCWSLLKLPWPVRMVCRWRLTRSPWPHQEPSSWTFEEQADFMALPKGPPKIKTMRYSDLDKRKFFMISQYFFQTGHKLCSPQGWSLFEGKSFMVNSTHINFYFHEIVYSSALKHWLYLRLCLRGWG